jgi:Mrp family chromosome partitioning ATPase
MLLIMVFIGSLVNLCQAENLNQRARPLNLQELNALRQRSKKVVKKRTTQLKAVLPEEIERLLTTTPSQDSLNLALSFRERLEKYNPSLEEFIIQCHWQLGNKDEAINYAQALLNMKESKTAHQVLFYNSLENLKLEEAEFHFSRANFQGIHWLKNWFNLYSQKLGWNSLLMASITGIFIILMAISARFLIKKRQKAPALRVANQYVKPKKRIKQIDNQSIKLPPILTLKPENNQLGFCSGKTVIKIKDSFDFSLIKIRKFFPTNSTVNKQNEILFKPSSFAFSFSQADHLQDSFDEPARIAPVEKQPDSQKKKSDSNFDFINSKKISLPALDFHHLEDLRAEQAEKLFKPVIKRICSLKEKVVGITATGEIDNRAGFAYLLGKALAGTGKKVLVIDADFARPMLNLFTDTPCIYGLKDLLGRKNANCRIDFQTEIENLSIAPSGTPDAKTQEKMNSEFWQLVIKMFKRKYDFILMVLPQLKKLGQLQLQQQQILYLTLMDEDSESSINDYFFSKIVLNKYNFSLFQPVNVFQQ